MRQSRRQFTLLELLAVITIIAILFSLMFGAFTKVRRAAKAAQCAAQQHDLYLSLTLFARNRKGMMPVPYESSYAVSNKLSTWTGRLMEAGFGTEKQIYCPATESSTTTVDTAGNQLRASYGLAGGNSGVTRHTVPVNSLKLAAPANTILLADSAGPVNLKGKSNFYLFDAYHGAHMVHSAKATVSFHDGAVILATESRLAMTEPWGSMVNSKYSYPSVN
ncbi:MAG: hypothetical protein RL095_4177 [Verrucomicrobiota bacterium]